MKLEARQKVWIELSSLFLDTDLTDDELLEIGQRLADTNFTYSEIRSIELYEVLPLLWKNQATIGFGEWLNFDNEWIIENCTQNFNKRTKMTHRLKCWYLNISNWIWRYDYWKKLKKKLK